MNAQEVVETIHGSYAKGSKHGLRNVRLLMERLCPDCRVPVIHIAGTNGKGSTCAMLESILRHAGFRTGLYTSPFLQMYQERIRLDGLPLDDDLLVRYGEPLIRAAKELEAKDVLVTPFEMGTALALSVFEGQRVDAAIVEVGLGGRLDPTNVVKPCLCGITAIGMDHMNFLGDTLEAIAGEKAGIIKENVPVVCHPAQDGVAGVFARTAREKHAPLHQLTMEMLGPYSADAHGSDWRGLRIPLPGEHQLTNAMVVLEMVDELRRQGWNIPEEAVRLGLAATRWPARLEWCGHVLIDGAHNPQGVAALRGFVKQHVPGKRVLLTGVLEDKLQQEMLTMLADLAEHAVTVTPDNPRAMQAGDLADALRTAGMAAEPADSLEAGLAKARELAGEGTIIATGSLYFAGALRTALGLPWR